VLIRKRKCSKTAKVPISAAMCITTDTTLAMNASYTHHYLLHQLGAWRQWNPPTSVSMVLYFTVSKLQYSCHLNPLKIVAVTVSSR